MKTRSIIPILASAALLLSGCNRSRVAHDQALPPGQYTFALSGSGAASNAVREAISKPLTGDFALPSSFLFLDPAGGTIALAHLPHLVADSPEARKLKLGPEAGKLRAYLLTGGGVDRAIDPGAVRDAADAIQAETATNRAVFFVGAVGTNRVSRKPMGRIRAYWVNPAPQAPGIKDLALAALDSAGFDVLSYQADPTLFWETVRNRRTLTVPPAGGSSQASAPRGPTQTQPAAPQTDRAGAASAPCAGRSESSIPSAPPTDRAGTASAPAEPPPKPVARAARDLPAAPVGVNRSPAPLVAQARAPLSAPATVDLGSERPWPNAIPSTTGVVPQAPAKPKQPAPAAPVPPQRSLEERLRRELAVFEVNGQHVLDAAPKDFVAIEYASGGTNDPITLNVNRSENREHEFPGADAGASRFIHRVRSGDEQRTFEGYGIGAQENAADLLVTVARRRHAGSREAIALWAIVRHGSRLFEHRQTLPEGVGLTVPMSQWLD